MVILTTYTCALVVTATGQVPVAYIGVVRNHDVPDIALLNTRTPAQVNYARVISHAFTGAEKQRNQRKQARRLLIWGKGTVLGATLTIEADGIRSNQYQWSGVCPDWPQGLLWSQGLIPIIGRTITATLEIAGTGIEVSEFQLQYVPYG